MRAVGAGLLAPYREHAESAVLVDERNPYARPKPGLDQPFVFDEPDRPRTRKVGLDEALTVGYKPGDSAVLQRPATVLLKYLRFEARAE